MSIRPFIPKFIHQIQFIKFYVFNACDAPFMLYMETARPITGEIAVALLQFDFVQFVKTLFKPKWLRRGGHTRFKGRNKKGRGGIPETADMLAELIDPDGDIRPRYYPAGVQVLVEFGEHLERAFWTVFLIEIIEGLFINTIIGVIESDKSNCGDVTKCLRTAGYGTVGGAGSPFKAIGAGDLIYINQASSPTGFSVRPLIGKCALVFSMGIVALNDGMSVYFRIIDTSDGNKVVEQSEVYNLDDGETGTVCMSATAEEGHVYQFQAHIPYGFIGMVERRIFMMQIGE